MAKSRSHRSDGGASTGFRLLQPLSCFALRADSKAGGCGCAIVCVGPFGDMKNYNNTDFYLSWYPTGLLQYTTLPSPTVEQSITPAIAAQVMTVSDKIWRH